MVPPHPGCPQRPAAGAEGVLDALGAEGTLAAGDGAMPQVEQ